MKLPKISVMNEFKLDWSYKPIHLLRNFWWRLLKNTRCYVVFTEYTILEISNVYVTLTMPDIIENLKGFLERRR